LIEGVEAISSASGASEIEHNGSLTRRTKRLANRVFAIGSGSADARRVGGGASAGRGASLFRYAKSRGRI